jgi:PAS domain S-box-containing protein
MKENLRKSGIDIVGDVPWGTHFCQFYHNREDLRDILVPYFKAGLENNEFCLWITSYPLEVEEAKEALMGAVSDIDVYLEKGQIEILSHTCLHIAGDIYDSKKVLNGWVEKLTHALESGYNGLRISGNTSWLEKKDWKYFVDYLEKMDEIIGEYRLISLGSYFVDRYSTTEIIEIVSNHQFSLSKREGKWEKIDNCGRKKAVEALERSEERFREVFTHAAAGLFIATPNIGCHDVNDRFCEITGYSREELKSKCCSQLVHPEDQEELAMELNCLLNAEKSSFVKDLRYVRLDDDIIWVRMNVSLLHYYENSAAAQQKLIGVVEDVTERKKAEEAMKKVHESLEERVKERTEELEKAYKSLKESKESLAEAQKIAHIGNWDWNLVTNEFYYSDELYRIFGLNPQELNISLDEVLNYIHPEDQNYVNNAIKDALSGNLHEVIDFRVTLADSTERIVSVKSRLSYDKNNNLVRINGTVQDITETKQAEEAMAKIETARKKEIHHRIKNNLQVVSSLLDLQAEKFKGKKNVKVSEVLEAFRDSQDRVISMALIHEELHKGGETDTGGGTDTLNFSQYIKELADNLFLTYRLGNDGISLDLDIEEDIFFDMDTSVPLGIIINELVSNSLKHAFPGGDYGEIRIKLHREKDGENVVKSKNEDYRNTNFILTVSDNGIGIHEILEIEALDSLGLQLVTSLVDQLNGKLELKRDNGTEFKLKFAVTEKNNQHQRIMAIN